MKKLNTFVGIALMLSALPLLAQADLTLTNASDSAYATGKIGKSACSAVVLHTGGVIAPHHTLDVPAYILTMYCVSDCKAQIFADEHDKVCGVPATATFEVDKKTGRVLDGSIMNFKLERYVVSGGDHQVVLNDAPTPAGFRALLRRILS